MFMNKGIQKLKSAGISFGYKPTGSSCKRISSFESNMTVLKTSLTPTLIAEQTYRTEPNCIQHIYLCNTIQRKDHSLFLNLVGRTTLNKNGKISIEKRYQMPYFLAKYTDIVLSHQWENGLNYAYFDALYGGYPLVHNSPFLPKGIGYFYHDFDAFDGAKVLLDVIKNHDMNHKQYLSNVQDYLSTLLPTNPMNIYLHDLELRRLFRK